jgi:pyruvate dehydrogenase E2 component (dihydrolipoamide acetyltransferase)
VKQEKPSSRERTGADTAVALPWGRVALADVLDAFQGGERCSAIRLLELDRLYAFWEKHPEDGGVRLSLTGFYVKAAALALCEVPRPGYRLHRYRELRPAFIDIGLSVAGRDPDSPYAPTVVIKDAAAKPLSRIAAEVRDKAREAREKEAVEIANLGKLAALMPLGVVRRAIIRFIARRPAVLRQSVGVFQVSNLQGSGLDLGISAVVAHSLLALGEVRERPVVRDGAVVSIPTTLANLQFDHRVMAGAHAGLWFEAFQRWLDRPHLLLHDDHEHAPENLTELL